MFWVEGDGFLRQVVRSSLDGDGATSIKDRGDLTHDWGLINTLAIDREEKRIFYSKERTVMIT